MDENKVKNNTKAEKTEKSSFSSKLGEYKGEFKKIVWPSKEELVKSSVTVVITCGLFGVAIFAMDFIFNQGMQLFINLVG